MSMTTKQIFLFATIAFAAGMLLSTVIVAHAGFIDDWITQKTESNPTYFEGQKRGYVSGGSYSARWPMKNDHLISFEPPRLKIGCGGIDAYLGGFSFLNFDYLVQKFQRILQNAPAAAFELALKNLCEPCANVMNALENLSNQLNGLQLDDCKSAKVVAARIMTNFTDNSQIRAEAQESYQLENGVKDLWTSITDSIKSDNYRPQLPDERDMYTGCPAEFRDAFLAEGSSILENIGAKRGYAVGYIEFMRGLMGDINVVLSTDPNNGRITINHHLVSPCPENSNLSLENIYNGEVYVKPAGGADSACVLMADQPLRDWAFNTVSGVAQKMSNKLALTAAEVDFMEHVPNIYSSLKVAVATGQESNLVVELSEFAAKAYAQMMMQDFYGGIRQSFAIARMVLSKAGQSASPDCKVDMVNGVDGEMLRFQEAAQKYADVTRTDYIKFVNEHVALITVAARYQEFSKLAKEKLSRAFTPALATRAMGNM